MASESLNASGAALHDASARQKPTAPTGNPPLGGTMFPLGYREGFSQWWAGLPAAVAEHKVLAHLPYLSHKPPTHMRTGSTADSPNSPIDSLTAEDYSQQGEVATNSLNDPYGPRRWRSSMVELSGKNRALNEFSVERVGEDANQHLVMLHGYGAGLGFFYKNFEALSRLKGWQLYALDMLGMGRSTRPSFKIKAKDKEEAIREAEAWFVDALEEWRVKRKIDRFTLLGHSMGGYMAVAYALKYPGHLNKLILASPVGIPEDPYAVAADMPEPSDSTLANEFTQDQQQIAESTNRLSNNNNNNNNNNYDQNRTVHNTADESDRPPRRSIPKWFAYLWDANISPFSIVRWSGPLGPRLVSGWTSRRFSHLPADEAKALHDYSYSIFRMRGSGEYALAYILAPGAFARSPLIRRIQGVGRQYIQEANAAAAAAATSTSKSSSWCKPSQTTTAAPAPATALSSPETPARRENGIPIVFMYGDHDWMDVNGGYASQAKLEEEKQRVLQNATLEEREADNGSSKVIVIKNAGHHVYLDGWEEFNQVMLEEMEDVGRRAGREHPLPPPSQP